LRALLGTHELDARLRLLDCDTLEPGCTGFAQLHCAEPVVTPAGEHVVLRLASPSRTVAGGKILEPSTRRARRNAPEILERLEDLRALPPAALIAAEVERLGPAGTPLRHLSQLSGLALPRVVALLEALPFVVTRAGSVLRKVDLDRLLVRIPPLLAGQAGGFTHAKLLSALPGTGVPLLDEALEQLLARHLIVKNGLQFLVPRPTEDRLRARGEAQLASRIAETLRRGGLTPPTPSELVTNLDSKRAVDRLLREGVIVRGLDRTKGKEILFHREAIEDAQRRLAPLLERVPGLLVTEVGAALGISRKYSLPLLDHLDTIRFTRRVEDRRIRGPRPAATP
jgi:selenocysteine-specific elongation factor